MSTEKPTSPTKICPTCGTRLSLDATRCLVCGADLGSSDKPAQPAKPVQGSRMPEITLSLPAAIGLLALFLTIGAVLVFYALKSKPEVVLALTATPTVTITVTPTETPTPLPPTITDTPQPTPTPITYKVVSNDTCIGIAAFFKVSVQSIVTMNDLPAACNTLYVGQPLLIPQATPTTTPLPSATLSVAQQTAVSCETVDYVVQEGDTLGKIAQAYSVPMVAIQTYNGLPNNDVQLGRTITIPLCERFATPGPTATATLPAPYPAPNLLLPPDGARFTLENDTVTLQWASVGILRDNERYMILIENVTEGKGRTLTDYVSDTKYIVPASFRSTDTLPYILRWRIVVVRQTGTDKNGNPIWDTAGSVSPPRDFIWVGVAATTPSP